MATVRAVYDITPQTALQALITKKADLVYCAYLGASQPRHSMVCSMIGRCVRLSLMKKFGNC